MSVIFLEIFKIFERHFGEMLENSLVVFSYLSILSKNFIKEIAVKGIIFEKGI
ncbi:MAG: hypothetical protein ACLFT3_14920 [Cyclobacteriaceae bacterium]